MHEKTSPQKLFLACLLGGLGVLALHTAAGLGGAGTNELFDDGVYNALLFGASLAVLARALTVQAQRPAWLAMGAGLLCWSLGELYFTLFVEGSGQTGLTPADGLCLAMYPCMYVALTLLIGSYLRELRMSMWLDGLIAGLAAASLAAAVLLPPILESSHEGAAASAVALAYPIGDILLLAFTIGALEITGWRPGRVWLLIAASMLLNAIVDSVYLYRTATDTWQADTWLECLWPAAAILLAVAAWTPWPRMERRRVENWRLVLVPALSLLAALTVLVMGNFAAVRMTPAAVSLAAMTVLAVCARLMVTVRENLTMLVGSRRLALTDPLTGLGNRRRLMEDLERACKAADPKEPWRLVLYDLNGFKRYNDTYGHPAGDELLARLSGRLSATIGAAGGTAYRIGGDEFCVLLGGARACERELERASVEALSEKGPGYAIGASHGSVTIPAEASDRSTALRLADRLLYERKDRVAGLDPFIALDETAPDTAVMSGAVATPAAAATSATPATTPATPSICPTRP